MSRDHGLVARIEFNRLWIESGCMGGGGRVFDELVQAYSAPRRHYHTLFHVCWVLRRLNELDDALGLEADRHAIRWAAWFHDAVLDGSSGDEFASSELARKTLQRSGFAESRCETVARLIKATAHEKDALREDEATLTDADIAILGAPREAFDEYERLVRLEWPYVSDTDFASARAGILRRFLDKPAIFHTALGRERWEAKARENLAYSIAKLEAT